MATPTTLPATFVAGNVLEAEQLNDLRGAFRVLQVVQSTLSTQFNTTSTSFTSVGLTATITPTSTSSAVLVMYSGSQANASGQNVFTTVYRGTTAGTNLGTTNGFGFAYSTAGGTTSSGVTGIILDTPATISAQVYTVAMKTSGGTGSWSENNTRSSITLMEISA
jgi:hypothetical protein